MTLPLLSFCMSYACLLTSTSLYLTYKLFFKKNTKNLINIQLSLLQKNYDLLQTFFWLVFKAQLLKYWLFRDLMLIPDSWNLQIWSQIFKDVTAWLFYKAKAPVQVCNFKNQNCFPIDVDSWKCVVHSCLWVVYSCCLFVPKVPENLRADPPGTVINIIII